MSGATDGQAVLASFGPLVEPALREACRFAEGGIARMVNYHLGWQDAAGRPMTSSGGKRVRPALALLACQVAGGTLHAALPAAVAVELLHNFTLIHDDIQDKSPTRRNRPTVWTIWGEAQAINAGDGLHVLAQRSLTGLLAGGLPADRFQAALELFADANLAICNGQYLDLDFEKRRRVAHDDYLTMIAGKTAALVSCSLQIGAIAGTADRAIWRAFGEIGHEIGLAYQIWDDYLGIWGDAAVTGKPVAEDILNRKKTLPVAYAFTQAAPDEAELLDTMFDPDSPSPVDVQATLTILESVGAHEYTRNLADHHTQRALDLLSGLASQAEPKAALLSVVEALVGRDH